MCCRQCGRFNEVCRIYLLNRNTHKENFYRLYSVKSRCCIVADFTMTTALIACSVDQQLECAIAIQPRAVATSFATFNNNAINEEEEKNQIIPNNNNNNNK